MPINILFYGASVTEQGGSEGYYECLKNKDFQSKFNFQKITFPGGNLNDAGFFGLMQISNLLVKPNCIFFEFATNWESSIEIFKLDIIFNYLKSLSILVVVLILPKTNNWRNERKTELLLYEYCVKFEFTYLDIRPSCYQYNLNELLRDEVHTNELGAQTISKTIFEFLDSNEFSSKLNLVSPLHLFESVDCDKIILVAPNILSYKIKNLGKNPEVAVKHLVGPYSCKIKIVSGDISIEKNLLDYWCYYEREKFDILLTSNELNSFSNEFFISISENLPDYSVLKFSDEDSAHIERSFRLISMTTFDCSIEIISQAISKLP